MSELHKEDYQEQRCLLCDEPAEVRMIPQQRIIEKMNDHMSRRDYAGAERHLLYWMEEAELGHDERGQLMLCGELVGHFRKTGNKEQAMKYAEQGLMLIDRLDFCDTMSAATLYVNIATACNAFDENERAIELFQKARVIYESSERTAPDLLGGLYNNMALTLTDLRRYEEAAGLYEKALKIMEQAPHGALEQAITWLNLADLFTAAEDEETAEAKAFDCLDKAAELLDTPSLTRDGYYAFVCEKCAPSFEYYGYFREAADLKERAEKIYAGA
ncbi:MAG: tetratricopeptide repeat protein [Clostridiales bacterium]|nr:tetratricopeptide repeat protein [Clostridiales bacterium]